MKYKIFPLLITLTIFLTVHGQKGEMLKEWTYIQIDSTKKMWGDWNEPEWLRYFGLDAADVDRDGNLDVISGRYIYKNPGGTMEDAWKRVVLDDNVDAILSVDIDGDPYADIIAMALPNLHWYESTNTSGTQYQKRLIGQVPATSHVNSQGFEKAQLITGGKLEFVIAGNGNIYAVQIPEKNADTVKWNVNMICQNTSDEGIGVGDIDGDGDLDIAAGRKAEGESEPKILVWFENPGHIDSLWKPTIVGESEHPIDRVEIADLNGDNKSDIVITEERYPGLEPDANFWWFAQNSIEDWKRNQIVEQYSINNLDIADIDNDGDMDLLTAEHKGEALELQLWKNDGQGNFLKNIIDTGKENHLGTQFIDLDNDGDLDIIGAGWDKHQFMHVWRNNSIPALETGMLFKDHYWIPEMVSDDGKFLRVGGKLDYATNEEHFPSDDHVEGNIPFNQNLNLENAVGATIFVERVQSHEDTKDLRIQFNNGSAIPLDPPKLIPNPRTDYLFHTNTKAAIPLSDLNDGAENVFKLTVSKDQSWNWPQNIVYGVVLRIYYRVGSRTIPMAKISGIQSGDLLTENVELELVGKELSEIGKVDYVGLYEDVNVQGDGRYHQWQFRYHRGRIQDHIGQSVNAPFKINWNTTWLPQQNKPVRLMPLITDKQGYTYCGPQIKNLSLDRDNDIDLIKPSKQPAFWTTRSKKHTQYFTVPFKIDKEAHVKLYWNSWSPCYSEGLKVNQYLHKYDNSTPCYDAFWHEEGLTDVTALKQGENSLTTLKTPLYNQKMVHGMDVQYPGVMLKIKQPNKPKSDITITESSYENRPHYIIHTKAMTYYFDSAGGGFSRIIDLEGNDWIGYRSKPWDQYPASAASAYRGLPNLVFGGEDGGAGHPGHDKCISKIIAPNRILTTTKNGEWEWVLTFHNDHALLEILKSPEESPYWFLYEGTPGGVFSPKTSYYGTNLSGPHLDAPDFYKGSVNWGHYQWGYFGRNNTGHTFFVAQVEADGNQDMMSYLGNTKDGVGSKNGMTVFGFGRNKNTQPLLKGINTFIIGMWDKPIKDPKHHNEISRHINQLTKKYLSNEE